MKTRFSTIDILAIITELQKYVGMRVNQVYDVDNKTYLIRLNRSEEKVMLLLESGIRLHTTEFEWPKNPSPSGFSMKLRKHIKNKRLENISQLGTDRIVDLKFGISEAAYHVILELYDRGNIVLTDFEYTILNILRPRASGSEDVKFIVREKYPFDKAQNTDSFNTEELTSTLQNAKDGDNLKKLLMPKVIFGPALLDHILIKNGFPKNCLINKQFKIPDDILRLIESLVEGTSLMKEIANKCQGYIFHKLEKNKDSKEIITNVEFHPYLFKQFSEMKYTEYPSFDKAVDNYFSGMEGQKIDLKALQKEKEALKKLENVKKDHEHRLTKLQENQNVDIKKAQLIEMNLELVDKAITVIRSAIANQISWSDIQDIIKEAQLEGDQVALTIKKLKLDINHFTVLLSNPHPESDEEEDCKPQLVDIDLDFSAYANARKYYDMKRAHAKKEQKTIESSEKAFKNAERKTKQALKEVAVTTSITKARKVMWFEKFLWFISSENYLLIGGRDVQQNELLVKRYLKSNDLYVHADLHGASSIVIKNPGGGEVPPKTLNEAGTMAVCNSTAWDAKVVTSAWWVYANQVSKTAPSGEYLTTGSFMIRGKKNYLTPAHLIMGFGFMFKLEEDSIQNHINERTGKPDEIQKATSEMSLSDHEAQNEVESDHSSDSSDDKCAKETDAKCEEETPKLVESDDNEDISFPDTEIKLDALTEETDKSVGLAIKNNSEGVVIQHAKKATAKQNVDKKVAEESTKSNPAVLKRGQRGKLKKIKEKYKHQDEEERELRMKILGSAGQSKDQKKGKNKKNKETKPQHNQPKQPKKSVHFIEAPAEDTILEVHPVSVNQGIKPESGSPAEITHVSEDEEEEDQPSEELQLLNSLTGCPVADDILLYAVPVCAPYSAMLNYKYKLKIIPGSSRRGKAAKTALQIFLQDKSATQREKDLLRSVKDQDISRNLPGKIKIASASYKKK